ncbi:hypothetical protein V8E51_001324 [Hyaloscypha variabilis]
MNGIYDIAIRPMLDTIKDLKKSLIEHKITTMFLVGGTSNSEWVRREIRDTFEGDGIEVVFSTHSASFHIGHLVSRPWADFERAVFGNEAVWGPSFTNPGGDIVTEAVQIMKVKRSYASAEPRLSQEAIVIYPRIHSPSIGDGAVHSRMIEDVTREESQTHEVDHTRVQAKRIARIGALEPPATVTSD